MHNLRYMTFDATPALIVVAIGAALIMALRAFEILAQRHVRERTRRAIAQAAAAPERAEGQHDAK